MRFFRVWRHRSWSETEPVPASHQLPWQRLLHGQDPKPTWRLLFVLSHMFFEAEQLERRHEGRAFIQHGQNRVSGLGRKHQDHPINAGVTVAF